MYSRVVKSHAGLQETRVSLMMGVNTRLISSRINIKIQRAMANMSHVNKHEALSNDFFFFYYLSAACTEWIMWVRTSGFGAVLVKQGEQVRGSGHSHTIISLNLTRDKATRCIPRHLCMLLSVTPCCVSAWHGTRKESYCHNFAHVFNFDKKNPNPKTVK